MGCGDFIQELKDHIPIIKKEFSFLLLILNIIMPGSGTILLICFGGTEFWIEHLLVGFIQFFSFPFGIGFFWSFYWGIIIVRKAVKWKKKIKI